MKIRVENTQIPDCKYIEWVQHSDDRGTLDMHYHRQQFIEAGLPADWPQDNVSVSRRRVLRGLHTQLKNPQGKLVRPLNGLIQDVCVDVRPYSPTFRKVVSRPLDEKSALYVPPGCLHGFQVIGGGNVVVLYKCTTLFDPETQAGVDPFDPKLGIHWPFPEEESVVSDKDLSLPSLDEFLAHSG